jgi:hypothetical protein
MNEPTTATELSRGPNPLAAALQAVVGLLAAAPQAFVGLLVPLPLVRLARGPIYSRFWALRNAVLLVLGGLWLLILFGNFVTFAVKGFPPFRDPPKLDPLTAKVVIFAILRGLVGVFQTQTFLSLIGDWVFWNSFPQERPELRPFERALKFRITIEQRFLRFVGTLFTIGLSVLPLSALLAALPVAAPNEAVLSDTVRPVHSRWRRFARRVFALAAGLIVLVALFAFAVEVVSRLPLPPTGQLAPMAKKVLGASVADLIMELPPPEKEANLAAAAGDGEQARPWLSSPELLEKRDNLRQAMLKPNQDQLSKETLAKEMAEVETDIEARRAESIKMRMMTDPDVSPYLGQPIWTLLPPALVQHWPFVLLVVYLADLGLLLLIGRVPLAYNLRYLWVRRRDTLLTAVVFTVVVAVVVVLLAFVNGMYKLNEGTGIPGNVLVLSDGATDELFSNLAYGDVSNVVQEVAKEDEKGRPMKPVGVARGVVGPDGRITRLPAGAPKQAPGAVFLASTETYLVMNQPVPVHEGEKPRRRFVQVRALGSAPVAAAVHNMELKPGGRWFIETGVERGPDGKTYLQAVIGDGAATTLGPDLGKPKLGVGDTFTLGDMDWVVIGLLQATGTTYGSEIWTSANNPVVQGTGKGNKFTTLVLRVADDSEAGAKAMAYHLQNRYDQAKLKAYAEPDYYKELTKSNEFFLSCIVMLAVVMAVGGVFGVMNTMFASIAARIKEVGVLRILGFKRWQILISFMLESLMIAVIGGALGCALGYLANFFEATSRLSSGAGGGPKDVALKMIVDYQTVAAGMLFTLVMGRLGGLVPALSAMRMEILDSLR